MRNPVKKDATEQLTDRVMPNTIAETTADAVTCTTGFKRSLFSEKLDLN